MPADSPSGHCFLRRLLMLLVMLSLAGRLCGANLRFAGVGVQI
ncbi:hypothetical protein MRBBS_2759 [Marinobacter sp. BSs20148]|nr:hypothetical protein MRBBS_2759 [Marinobacter sp. BSs20148]